MEFTRQKATTLLSPNNNFIQELSFVIKPSDIGRRVGRQGDKKGLEERKRKWGGVSTKAELAMKGLGTRLR
jgi:hypothetical protein